jgi:hypothetical protein
VSWLVALFLLGPIVVAVVARVTDWPEIVWEEGDGLHPPSPHGCTHGYYIPCDRCSPAIRARYMRNPESFPVYIRDERGVVIGIDGYEVARCSELERVIE